MSDRASINNNNKNNNNSSSTSPADGGKGMAPPALAAPMHSKAPSSSHSMKKAKIDDSAQWTSLQHLQQQDQRYQQENYDRHFSFSSQQMLPHHGGGLGGRGGDRSSSSSSNGGWFCGSQSSPSWFGGINRNQDRTLSRNSFASSTAATAPIDLSSSSLLSSSTTKPAETITEEVIADAMSKLTVEERERGHEDVYGMAAPIEETETFVSQKLKEFETEIRNLLLLKTKNNRNNTPHNDRKEKNMYATAYEIAFSQCPAYVQDDQFRLAFLRADEFNVKDAVNRYLSFFETKMELFGTSKLTKDITISDIGDDGYQALVDGSGQVVPQTDHVRVVLGEGASLLQFCKSESFVLKNISRIFFFLRTPSTSYCREPVQAGRTVVLAVPSLKSPTYSIAGMMKWHYYFCMALIENNLNAQRLGIVFIMWVVNDTHIEAPNLTLLLFRLRKSLPLRQVGLHFCANRQSVVLEKVASFFLNALNAIRSTTRARIRHHFGSPMEVSYSLMSFGVPVEAFPIDVNHPTSTSISQNPNKRGIYDMTNQYRWIETRQQIDAMKDQQYNVAQGMPETQQVDILPDRFDEAVDEILAFDHSLPISPHDKEYTNFSLGVAGNDIAKDKNASMDISGKGNTVSKITNESSDSNSGADAPQMRLHTSETRSQDVLLGRGRPLQSHFGNMQLRRWIEERHDEYEKATKKGKTDIAESIVMTIQSSGGRFLRQDNDKMDGSGYTSSGSGGSKSDYWIPIDDQTARLKVAYGFRTYRKAAGRKRSAESS